MSTEWKKNNIIDFDDEPSRSFVLSADIDEESAYDVMKFILFINEYDDFEEDTVKDYVRKPIKLYINSFGGSVYDGFAIVGVIENSKTPVHTYGYGSVMSMALLIFVTGHYRYANRFVSFMYHEILDQPVYEKLSALSENIEESRRIMTMYDGHLLAKSILKKKQLDDHKKNKSDWYMTADIARKCGFVDEII
jgi:ATP-dependent Clp protease protease subunit